MFEACVEHIFLQGVFCAFTKRGNVLNMYNHVESGISLSCQGLLILERLGAVRRLEQRF